MELCWPRVLSPSLLVWPALWSSGVALEVLSGVKRCFSGHPFVFLKLENMSCGVASTADICTPLCLKVGRLVMVVTPIRQMFCASSLGIYILVVAVALDRQMFRASSLGLYIMVVGASSTVVFASSLDTHVW